MKMSNIVKTNPIICHTKTCFVSNTHNQRIEEVLCILNRGSIFLILQPRFCNRVFCFLLCLCLFSYPASFHQHQHRSQLHLHRLPPNPHFLFYHLLSSRIVHPLPPGLRSSVPACDRPIRAQPLSLLLHPPKTKPLLRKPTFLPVNRIRILLLKQRVLRHPEVQECLTTPLNHLLRVLSHHLLQLLQPHLLQPLLPGFLLQQVFPPLHLLSTTLQYFPLVINKVLLRLLLPHLSPRRHLSHHSTDLQETPFHLRCVCFVMMQ